LFDSFGGLSQALHLRSCTSPERTSVGLKYFRVLLNGQNLSIELEGKVQKVGFYTTRFVEADTQEEAEASAIDLIRADARLLTIMLNAIDDTPVFLIDEISELIDDLNQVCDTGFSFYREDEES
jgi:hypothetical protein